MHNLQLVKGLKAFEELDEVGPAFGLGNASALLFALGDALQEVTAICELHHDIQRLSLILHKRLLIRDNVLISGEESNINKSGTGFLT